MTEVVVIGGGHNGLVCAAYLAGKGCRVHVLERHETVGGAAVTEEFSPGFRNSVASYTVSLLHPRIIEDLHLSDHGLQLLPRPVNNYLPRPDGNSFIAFPETDSLIDEIARFSQRDAEAYASYDTEMDRLSAVVRETLLEAPLQIHGGGIRDLFTGLGLTRRFGKLTAHEKQRLLSLFSISAGEWLDDVFETDLVKAWLGFDAIVGNYQSPYSPGSAYVMLHHRLGQLNGEAGRWGHAVGGMGAVSNAIATEAENRGVHIATTKTVTKVLVEKGAATGVELVGGDQIKADVVVSNVNPRILYLNLIPGEHLHPETIRHFERYKCGSGSFRLNVALSGLPQFSSRIQPDCLSAGIILAPSLDYMDRAYLDARRLGFSQKPVVEMLIPSLMDNSLAPPGQHVASLFCQQFDPELGETWDEKKHEAVDRILSVVDEFAPGFSSLVTAVQAFSPMDLERRFGLTGGDIFHGRMSLDQLYSARPMVGSGRYQTEIKHLFMCGAGAHPGGGVSGMPGYNAAMEILRQL